MVAHLSDEWIRAVSDALERSDAVAASAPLTPLVVQHTVVDDDGERSYHLVLGAHERRAVAGHAAAPDIRFTLTRDTATAIAGGRRNAALAVLTGCLRTGGDLRALLAHRGLFAAVDDALESVRARTEHPGR